MVVSLEGNTNLWQIARTLQTYSRVYESGPGSFQYAVSYIAKFHASHTIVTATDEASLNTLLA